MSLRFDGQVAVVTGAGGGLGREYALFLASRGAKVVVNDLGGSTRGEGSSSRAADAVVTAIRAAGGSAVADYHSVEEGDQIIEAALRAFGGVHIVINNAGILRDVSFKNMTDQDWDLINAVHVKGSYKVARAAWPVFRKQKYGRIVNTASASGLYGNFGQCNYSAAKLGMVGFTETLAKEGEKYNIVANVIAPVAASRMTASTFPAEVLEMFKPEWVAPLVAWLLHGSNKDSGGIYEVGAGFVFKLRWERAGGALFKADESLTPSAIHRRWDEVQSFKGAVYPDASSDYSTIQEAAEKLSKNAQGMPIDLRDKVALVTGAGGGLGRAYVHLLARMGASVVVNDISNPDKVVDEIRRAGGKAVGDRHDVNDGDALVKTCLDNFGGIHIVINNAGILKDKSFASMTDQQWDDVMRVHVRGTFKVTKAAWPHLLKQKYGRIVNTSSTSGIYGNFGQANYATAKCMILGFSRALAREGEKYNILVNTLAPNAGTAMTATVLPEELVQAFKPEYVAPLVALLASDQAHCTGQLFEIGSGWIGRVRWQRTGGVQFDHSKKLQPEDIANAWEKIRDFEDGRATHPESANDSLQPILESFSAMSRPKKTLDPMSKAQQLGKMEISYVYDDRDVILYNLGLGARSDNLRWVYEGDDHFEVLPSFGVIPMFEATNLVPLSEILPNFSPMMLLHGEQYLEVRKYPIPLSGTLKSRAAVIDVIDKQKAGAVVIKVETTDDSGEMLFYNESTIFVRGSGGFGGKAKGSNRGAATAANTPPRRPADTVVEEATTASQAALYRLSGDRNPLHIDPEFAAMGKFPRPILHGLATFGISSKHIFEKYGPYRNIKVRFSGHVFPGETLRTEMWKEGQRVVFVTKVKERDTVAISAAAVELQQLPSKL